MESVVRSDDLFLYIIRLEHYHKLFEEYAIDFLRQLLISLNSNVVLSVEIICITYVYAICIHIKLIALAK